MTRPDYKAYRWYLDWLMGQPEREPDKTKTTIAQFITLAKLSYCREFDK